MKYTEHTEETTRDESQLSQVNMQEENRKASSWFHLVSMNTLHFINLFASFYSFSIILLCCCSQMSKLCILLIKCPRV